jgi:enoyl-CoA hydratase/carnithine racemase
VAGEVRVERDGQVGWVVIDNPERRNALTGDMFRGLSAAVAGLDADPSVHVVVVRGAGTQAFASGADIGDLGQAAGQGASPADGADGADGARGAGGHAGEGQPGGGQTGDRPLFSAAKPVMAMIHGACTGGGLLVALGADVRMCADDARFAIPAVRLGVAYPFDGVRRLVATVGPSAAAEILLTGSTFGADDALRWGLVSRVVPAAHLEVATTQVALAVASGAPLSVRAAKESLRAAASEAPPDAVAEAIRACWESEDFAEGRRAFAEKRPPVFRGR